MTEINVRNVRHKRRFFAHSWIIFVLSSHTNGCTAWLLQPKRVAAVGLHQQHHRTLSLLSNGSNIAAIILQQQQQHAPHSNPNTQQHQQLSSQRSSSNNNNGDITDWVIENLENSKSGTSTSITTTSTYMAGENDTLPMNGLCIGKVRILPSDSKYMENDIDTTTTTNDSTTSYYKPIRLYVGRNGWGTGVHPSTHLCIEWLCNIMKGSGNNNNESKVVLDYGCGSGILSITALHMGATQVYGVDIEAEALVTAQRNIQLNGYNPNQFIPLHTREVLPYGIHTGGVDICVANILIGQLIRPSMIAALMTNLKSNTGRICFSGIRPGDQVITLRNSYSNYIDEWIIEDYKELSSINTPYSINSYGYDCGIWCRVVGRRKNTTTQSRMDDIISMSDLAVS